MAHVTRFTHAELATLAAERPSAANPVDLAALVAAAPAAVAAASPADLLALTRYRVPRVTEDGTCSRPDDLLPEPFDLLAALHGATAAAVGDGSPATAAVLARQWVLARAMRTLADATGADWVGVYRAVPTPGGPPGQRALAKEAYVGAPSRALFPLTPSFAEHSNNSTVGLSGSAILIGDTRRLDDATPYYVCDAKVRSELCVPIFAPGGLAAATAGTPEVIGIIDAEAFAPGHFTPARRDAVLAVAAALGEAGLLVSMLPLPQQQQQQ
jgi:L-methionine (R)-S-oxide reductase